VRNSGETFGDFRKRCIGWWKETVSVLIGENSSGTEDKTVHVLVVSHGGFIRMLLGDLVRSPEFRFGGDYHGVMPNTGVSIVEAVGVYDGRILMYGDNTHLEGIVETDGEVSSVEDK
jgi:broad specificity phosphatase PhoE